MQNGEIEIAGYSPDNEKIIFKAQHIQKHNHH